MFDVVLLIVEHVILFFYISIKHIYIHLLLLVIKYMVYHTGVYGGVLMKICLTELRHDPMSLNGVPQVFAHPHVWLGKSICNLFSHSCLTKIS